MMSLGHAVAHLQITLEECLVINYYEKNNFRTECPKVVFLFLICTIQSWILQNILKPQRISYEKYGI